MAQDLYSDFAARYDRFYDRFDAHDPLVVRFFRQLLDPKGVHSLLDCACGTGRDLHLFHSLGYQVVGSDVSESMLAQAEQNLTALGLNVPLYRLDYRELPRYFDEPFDAVVCLSSSILHMPDEAQVLRAFESMRQVLRDGGILMLTQGTTDKQWTHKPRFIPAVHTRDFTRLFVIDYLEKGARHNILDLIHSEEARDLIVWTVEYPQILLRDDYQRLLRASGLETIDFYGTYRFDPYDMETSDRLIIVTQR